MVMITQSLIVRNSHRRGKQNETKLGNIVHLVIASKQGAHSRMRGVIYLADIHLPETFIGKKFVIQLVEYKGQVLPVGSFTLHDDYSIESEVP